MFLMRKKEIKKGFTLVELLAVIVILAIILITILSIINVVFSDVDETISEAEENVILSAAENYALEYRGTTGEHGSNNWNEEIEMTNDGEEVSFCVSLKSLIDYGYFKDDKSNFSKYKDNKAVYFKIKNGVIVDETFIDLKNDEDGKCKYYIKNSSFADGEKTSGSKEVNAGDESTPIGNFEYKVNELGNNRYSAYLDFKLDMNPIFKQVRPINIVFVLDATGSMGNSNNDLVKGTAYYKAAEAIEKFTTEVVKKDSKLLGSQIALIEYGGKPVLTRDFATSKLSIDSDDYLNKSDFSFTRLGYTNVGTGIDMATSLIYTSFNYGNNNVDERENTYVILLFDGEPTSYSYCKYKESDSKVISLGTEGQTTNIKFNYLKDYLTNGVYKIPTNDDGNDKYINIYYKKYKSAGWCNSDGCPTSKSFYCDEITNTGVSTSNDATTVKRAKAQTIEASNFLKSLDVKFITLGYNFDGGKEDNNMREIATQDNNLCIDVGKFETYKNSGKNYCYYESNEDDVNELFNGLLHNIIYYNNALEWAELIFEPKPTKKGGNKPSIILYDKNGQRVDGNVITEQLNELGSLGENDKFSFLNNYTFEISDDLYEEHCSGVKAGDTCYINGIDLFSVSVNLKYMSRNETDTIVLEVPEFNLTLTKNEKIN